MTSRPTDVWTAAFLVCLGVACTAGSGMPNDEGEVISGTGAATMDSFQATHDGGAVGVGGGGSGGVHGGDGDAGGGLVYLGGSSSGGFLGVGGEAGGGGGVAAGGTGGIETGGAGTGGVITGDQGDPNFHIFLLLGQSNMDGKPSPQAQDLVEDPRIQVLAYDNCGSLGRTEGQWYPASPPLHSCGGGVGPGDYFAKTLIQSLPEGSTIGLVPCGVIAADIDLFRKNAISARRGEFYIPPDDHWQGAYEWIVQRARLAQESGIIRGILMHHGESDTGQQAWADKVAEIVSDLKQDLQLGDIPFLAGELAQDSGGIDACCESHNPIIGRLPSMMPNTHVVSSAGLPLVDSAHFSLQGQRDLGTRYADAYLQAPQP